MSAQFTHGHALVIGAGADLPVTVTDAAAIATLLRDPARCAYPPDRVQLLTGAAARRADVLQALDQLAEQTRADPEATAVIYFSGHGVETPSYYFLPYGYDAADFPGTAVSSSEFTGRLRAIRARKLVVLLDCCHAGGQAEAKGHTKSPLPPSVAEQLESSSGRVVLASSRKDEVSWTGRPYSVFTAALLEGLAGYGAFERDGYARILDLAMWAGRKVPERTGETQHPIIKVSNLGDNFPVAWYAGGTKVPQPLPWTPTALPAVAHDRNAAQLASRQRQLANYRENLLLIEERASEYVEFNQIPLQLVKNKRETEARIRDLEVQLQGGDYA